MRAYPSSVWQWRAALVVIACCFAGAQSAIAAPAAPISAIPEVQELRAAYLTLYVADHDYKGHRVRAMHALEKACDLLGTDIRGDGKGHEPQTLSDAQLQHAQQTVEQVRNGIGLGSQPRVLKLLDEAIAQISAALKAK